MGVANLHLITLRIIPDHAIDMISVKLIFAKSLLQGGILGPALLLLSRYQDNTILRSLKFIANLFCPIDIPFSFGFHLFVNVFTVDVLETLRSVSFPSETHVIDTATFVAYTLNAGCLTDGQCQRSWPPAGMSKLSGGATTK